MGKFFKIGQTPYLSQHFKNRIYFSRSLFHGQHITAKTFLVACIYNTSGHGKSATDTLMTG